MSKSFKLNPSIVSNIKAVNSAVDESEEKNAARLAFNLTILNVDDIIFNEKNKVGIRNIEELAENIREIGLATPIAVNKLSNGVNKLISGERRLRAYRLCYEQDKTAGIENSPYKYIPVKVYNNLNETDEEIALHQLNAQARVLNDSEKLYMVERLTALYKEKKDRGEKIPGRIRELIAKDLDMSVTNVGRYEAISKNLAPSLKKKMETGDLGFTQAAQLASLPAEEQKQQAKEIIKAKKQKEAQPPIDMDYWETFLNSALRSLPGKEQRKAIYDYYKNELPSPAEATKYIKGILRNHGGTIVYENGKAGSHDSFNGFLRLVVDDKAKTGEKVVKRHEATFTYTIAEKYLRKMIAANSYLPDKEAAPSNTEPAAESNQVEPETAENELISITQNEVDKYHDFSAEERKEAIEGYYTMIINNAAEIMTLLSGTAEGNAAAEAVGQIIGSNLSSLMRRLGYKKHLG